MRFLTASSVLLVSAASVILAGCAGFQAPTNTVTGPVTLTGPKFKGSSYGGRQPIANATVTLYQAGTTGYGAGATALQSTTTNANGAFEIPAFTCTSGTQLYVVAAGGDPYGNGENNSAANLMAGLTSCDNVNAGVISFVSVNEVTTVATVWALAPFMNGLNIGTSSTNAAGLASAFADIATLVNIESGVSPGTGNPNGQGSLPTGTVVPNAEINAIANSLAACVNSVNGTQTGGGGNPTSTACTMLYTAATAGGTTPSDIEGAALNIARYPGNNPSGVLAVAPSTPPYQPNIASANDLTIGITYTGAGSLNSPSAVAVDASGNIWVTNNPSGGTATVTAMSHTGVPLTGSPFGTGIVSGPSAIAIDTSGNAWVANSSGTNANSLSEISSTGTVTGPFTGGGLSTPTSISFDGLGNIWLSNSGNSSASEFSSTGTAISGTSGYTASGVSSPVGVAVNPH